MSTVQIQNSKISGVSDDIKINFRHLEWKKVRNIYRKLKHHNFPNESQTRTHCYSHPYFTDPGYTFGRDNTKKYLMVLPSIKRYLNLLCTFTFAFLDDLYCYSFSM